MTKVKRIPQPNSAPPTIEDEWIDGVKEAEVVLMEKRETVEDYIASIAKRNKVVTHLKTLRRPKRVLIPRRFRR